MRVADTSALYAFFFEDDPHHGQARAEIGSAEPILVPAEILAETLLLVERRAGFEAARAAGTALRKLPNLEVQPTWDEPWDNLMADAWLEFQAGDGRLSYADAIVVAWCLKRRIRALSFDKALERAAKAA